VPYRRSARRPPNETTTWPRLGFGGQTDLSGGQWQRLALARLLYQDAPVIFLNEPVASLDPEGERAIFEFLSQRAHSKLIIFTTHRYDSIPDNAKIVVLVDGVLTESGTHEELLHKRRDYLCPLCQVPRHKRTTCAGADTQFLRKRIGWLLPCDHSSIRNCLAW
jgi:ABC-type transport system involved in cytochrome bd biosynthesis fused ATPase/permease subunit